MANMTFLDSSHVAGAKNNFWGDSAPAAHDTVIMKVTSTQGSYFLTWAPDHERGAGQAFFTNSWGLFHTAFRIQTICPQLQADERWIVKDLEGSSSGTI
jgi:hypothetical protein